MVALVLIIAVGAFITHWGAKSLEAFTADDALSRSENLTGMLVFLMEGCGYCKDLELNVLSKFKEEIKNGDILLVKRGEGKATELIEKYNVSGFPTIYFLTKGQIMRDTSSGANGEYDGPRDFLTIKNHFLTATRGYTDFAEKKT